VRRGEGERGRGERGRREDGGLRQEEEGESSLVAFLNIYKDKGSTYIILQRKKRRRKE
jgi:hypothetical protein